MVEKITDNTFDPGNSRPFAGVPSWDVPLVPYRQARSSETKEAVHFFESLDEVDRENMLEERRREQGRLAEIKGEWNRLLEPVRSQVVSTYGHEIERLLRIAGAATFNGNRGADYRYYEKSLDQDYTCIGVSPFNIWVAAGDLSQIKVRRIKAINPGYYSGERAAYAVVAGTARFDSVPDNAQVFDIDGELIGRNQLVVSVGLDNECVGPILGGYDKKMHTFWVGDPDWRDVLLSGIRYFYEHREIQGLVVKSSNTPYGDTIPGPEPGAFH